MSFIPRTEWLNQAQWAITSPLLFAAVLGVDGALTVVLAVTVLSIVGYGLVLRDLRPYRVQVRLGFLGFISIAFFAPGLNALLWIPAFGTAAQTLLGYCPMARFLDLMPWNRAGLPGLADVIHVITRAPGNDGLLSPLFARRIDHA